jgi:hypothetical protein
LSVSSRLSFMCCSGSASLSCKHAPQQKQYKVRYKTIYNPGPPVHCRLSLMRCSGSAWAGQKQAGQQQHTRTQSKGQSNAGKPSRHAASSRSTCALRVAGRVAAP